MKKAKAENFLLIELEHIRTKKIFLLTSEVIASVL